MPERRPHIKNKKRTRGMGIKHIILSLAAATGLAACGNTIPEQAVGGAAIGAGAAAITDNNIAKGAAVGAAGNLLYCQLNPGKCG